MSDLNQERSAEELAAQVVENLDRRIVQDEPGVVLLSTGVRLRAKEVPKMLLTDIVAELEKERPELPQVYIEVRKRWEPNPNDPDYVERVKAFQAKLAAAINNAFILRGTEIASVPEGFPGPNDQEFILELEAMGRPSGTPRIRYLAWVKYEAAPRDADITNLLLEIGRASSVSESDVRAAVDRFQRSS